MGCMGLYGVGCAVRDYKEKYGVAWGCVGSWVVWPVVMYVNVSGVGACMGLFGL